MKSVKQTINDDDGDDDDEVFHWNFFDGALELFVKLFHDMFFISWRLCVYLYDSDVFWFSWDASCNISVGNWCAAVECLKSGFIYDVAHSVVLFCVIATELKAMFFGNGLPVRSWITSKDLTYDTVVRDFLCLILCSSHSFWFSKCRCQKRMSGVPFSTDVTAIQLSMSFQSRNYRRHFDRWSQTLWNSPVLCQSRFAVATETKLNCVWIQFIIFIKAPQAPYYVCLAAIEAYFGP